MATKIPIIHICTDAEGLELTSGTVPSVAGFRSSRSASELPHHQKQRRSLQSNHAHAGIDGVGLGVGDGPGIVLDCPN